MDVVKEMMNRSFNENNLVDGVAASFKKSLVVKALAPDHASACARACTQQDNRTATRSRLVIKGFRAVRGGFYSFAPPFKVIQISRRLGPNPQ